MALFSIAPTSFSQVLANRLSSDEEVFLPKLVSGNWAWRRASAEDLAGEFDLGPARATEPVKSLFLPPRGEVARFFGEDTRTEPRRRIVVGARQCDLAALKILDFVFLEGSFKDPFYAERRERTLVISADCTEPYEVCFCTFVEGSPSPSEGFDLNLSLVAGELLVETGSPKGERFVEENRACFGDATARASSLESARRKVADALAADVRSSLLDFPEKVRHITRGREDHPVWDARAKDCVECGACNFVCPTCHCFYLVDVESDEAVRRFANWDSCLYPKFAVVAGGHNPRPRRAQRLLNRFEKKFSFFCDNMDALACTGCGRCVEACAGKIDMRDVLRGLAR